MKKIKKFTGWQIVRSRNGCDWGLYKQWEPVSPIFKTKKEAQSWWDTEWHQSGCLPTHISKIYK